jgi:hypothetical protein
MLAIEREFVAVIYALYGFDCLHWLKPGQTAYTRRLNNEWKKWANEDGAFTLLGRMPVVTNPFELRPGWIVLDAERPSAAVSAKSTSKFLQDAMPHWQILAALCAMGAMNLLVLLPAIVVLGLLERGWVVPCVNMLVIHFGIVYEVYRQGGKWRSADSGGFWREYIALLLNPIAALRSGDLLCRSLFGLEGE